MSLRKQFSCTCGCKKFILVQSSGTLVDFTREGAVEGHPYLTHLGNVEGELYLFKCDDCGVTVPNERAQEMLKEVL